MNGSTIQPTVELATTNGGNGFAYPFYPMGYGNGGLFGGADNGIWGIILLALLFGNGNFGWGGNNTELSVFDIFEYSEFHFIAPVYCSCSVCFYDMACRPLR